MFHNFRPINVALQDEQKKKVILKNRSHITPHSVKMKKEHDNSMDINENIEPEPDIQSFSQDSCYGKSLKTSDKQTRISVFLLLHLKKHFFYSLPEV